MRRLAGRPHCDACACGRSRCVGVGGAGADEGAAEDVVCSFLVLHSQFAIRKWRGSRGASPLSGSVCKFDGCAKADRLVAGGLEILFGAKNFSENTGEPVRIKPCVLMER